MKITGVVRSAEEITGVPGLIAFTLIGNIPYIGAMNDLAGQRIELQPTPRSPHDYLGNGFGWLRDWLKDISYIDWDEVPVDTKIEVQGSDEVWKRRHFAYYDKAANLVYAYLDGKTSFTETKTMYWGKARLFNPSSRT